MGLLDFALGMAAGLGAAIVLHASAPDVPAWRYAVLGVAGLLLSTLSYAVAQGRASKTPREGT